LAAAGHNEEALQRHVWYHNHALEFAPSQSGVRLSFALSDWVELGRRFPKARQALVEIRDRTARELTETRGSFQVFMDVSSINSYLQEEEKTIELFKRLQDKNPALARKCFKLAEKALVNAHEYELCYGYLPDAQAEFQSLVHARGWLLGRNQSNSG